MALIEVKNLSKVYREGRGLRPANFTVDRGELVAIIGHNGAGKSTLLKILAGWHLPGSGSVDIDGLPRENRLAMVRKIGFVPEVPNLFESFSVDYNLRLFARLFGVSPLRVEEILQEFDLLPFRRSKVLNLSKGLRQRLSIGRSLLADPLILLFDEPTSGLDFEMTKEIYRLISDFHASGKTVIFTSHRPEEIRSLATRVIMLHQGDVVFDGAPTAYFSSKIYQELGRP